MRPPPVPPSELLAPAGSIEAFFAALEAGADAVYCGLKDFSARARARNFTLDELAQLNAHAHQQGRKLYVALNTLLKERELPRLVEILVDLAALGVDGLIIQDLGLWRLVREHFPELPLHASTQMAIHNAAGVRMLEGMGFTRAVLARELSLAEIAIIRRQTSMELEHFVHGALCYSLSGLCLFSSFLSGQSGNRGRCAQPCRRRYQLRGKPGFYFSTSDLCAIGLLPQLLEAGVMSFKIEGRMKNAEYVATVVQAYRDVLDAPVSGRTQAIRQAEERLRAAYGRGTTCGLLKGVAPAGIASPTVKGGIGRPLGRVDKVQGSAVWLTVGDILHVGDRVRIQPHNDQAGTAFTVQELRVKEQMVKRAATQSRVRIGTPFHGLFQPGDEVYKVGGGKTFTLSEESCLRRLAKTPPPTRAVRISLAFREDGLRLQAEAAGCVITRDYQVEMLPALHSPLDRATLTQTFAKTGHPGLRLDTLELAEVPPVAIKPSRMNEVRRDLYGALASLLDATLAQRREERRIRVTASLLPARAVLAAPASPRLALRLGQASDLGPALREGGDHHLILALTPEMVAEAARLGQRLTAAGVDIVWDLPAIIFDGDWPSFQAVIAQLARQGFPRFRLNNLGQFRLLAGLPRVSTLAGPWLYAMNSQAALALAELGAAEFSLALEDDGQNMADLLGRELGIPATATVYGPIPLVTSRIPMRGIRSGAMLESEGGEAIRLHIDRSLSTAYSGQEFSLLGEVAELRQMGCGQFLVDLAAVGLSGRRGQEVLAAARTGQGLDGAQTFNFRRGLA